MPGSATIPHASDTLFPQPGDAFAERYRIESLVGRGGFSRVYSATQQELGRIVAIKVLAPTPGRAREVVEQRFYREARLASRLQGPHTVTMHDYGRTPDGLLFMVSELVEGKDLQQLIAETGALGAQRSRRIFTQIVRGLQEAHSKGFLHRDVKPSNIMVFDQFGERDVVKLLDFGIAKGLVNDGGTPELTLVGAVIGTPGYMAPEQAMGKGVTEASDLFSAGLVAYEMLVGQSPLRGLGFAQIQRRLTTEPIELPPTVAVEDDFALVLARVLELAPERRYQSAAEVLVDLGDATAADIAPPPNATPRLATLQTFPMMFDTTGVTTVDTLTDAETGNTRTVDLPLPAAGNASADAAPEPGRHNTPFPTPVLVLGLVAILAILVVLLLTDDEPLRHDVVIPYTEASAVVIKAIRNAELDAEIRGKEIRLKPKPKAQNPKPKTQSLKPKTQSPKPKAQNPSPKTQKPPTPKPRDFDVKPIDEL